MSFQRALEENRPPRRIGDTRLRYESPLLIGEARARWSILSEPLRIAALGCGLAGLASLAWSPRVLWAVLLAAATAALTLASMRADGRRGRRRFVLHFSAETLRLERPARGGTRVVPFDAVHEVAVKPGEPGFYLLEASVDGPEEAFVLVDRVPGAEVEELRRLWRILRTAFGLQLTV